MAPKENRDQSDPPVLREPQDPRVTRDLQELWECQGAEVSPDPQVKTEPEDLLGSVDRLERLVPKALKVLLGLLDKWDLLDTLEKTALRVNVDPPERMAWMVSLENRELRDSRDHRANRALLAVVVIRVPQARTDRQETRAPPDLAVNVDPPALRVSLVLLAALVH